MADAPKSPLPHTRKVSRLPPLPETLDPVLAERFRLTRERGGEPLNLHLTQGHAPKLAKAKSEFTWVLRNETKLGRKLLELTIVRTANIVGCPYELNHHLPMLKKAGYSDAQIAALEDLTTQSPLFDERERALLGFVDQLCDKGRVDDQTFAGVSKHFMPQEIVEIAYSSTSYYATGLLANAMQIQIDEPHIKATQGKF